MNLFEGDITIYAAILFAALGTYALRAGGLLFAEKIPQMGRLREFMNALPGTILLSLVMPGMVASGVWGILAGISTAFCVYKTRNLLLSVVVGMGIMIISRQF